MTEQEVLAKCQEWEATGFIFVGNGTDDDLDTCPNCGDEHVFWSFWEHPGQTRYIGEEKIYNPQLARVANLCVRCGHRWIEEEQQVDLNR